MGTIDRRLTDLERQTGGGDQPTVTVDWSGEDPQPGPGETVKVIRWTQDDEIEVEIYRGE